jgi:hypothetical protein
MATAEKVLKPTDLADPDPWPCWHAHGWEMASEWSMHDATNTTRAEARASALYEVGDWTEIGVWKRYVRLFTRQESWCWLHGNSPVPEDWRPGEGDAVWTFCHRSDPDAKPYWVVGLQADGPPPNPAPPVVREEDGTDA